MDRISTSPSGGHHLSEQDDTPMPLRISKKREPENPDHYWRQRSTTIATSPTLPNLRTVPTRQTSLPKSQTQPGILRKDNAALSAQLSSEMHSLRVPKQRNTTTTITSINPDQTHPRGTTPPPSVQDALSVENDVSFGINKTPHRANTTGSVLSSELLNLSNEGPLNPPAPTPFLPRSRSTATVRQESKREVTKRDHDDHPASQGLSRRISLRGRFISRVMNGLTSRQNTGQHDGSIKEHKEIVQQNHDKSTMKHHDEVAPKHHDQLSRQRSSRSTHSRANSTVTSGVHSINSSILDSESSAFPSPPTTTNIISPTMYPSMAALRAESVISGSSQACEGVAIVGAEISVVPEAKYLESEDAQSVFVAVEIKGTLNEPEDGDNPQRHGLEVAVVIDNSLFTSPATLMASCEGTRCLASLLDIPDDKLAILCTSPERFNVQSRIVYPLSAVSDRQVKSAVDSILGSTEQPDHESTWATIKCAMELLTSTTPASRDILGTFGQIFIFTANPSGLPPTLLHEVFHIHVICPGAVFWKGQRNVECNGWKMRSSFRNDPEFVGDKKQQDSTALSSLLQTAVSRARYGKISGKLTDLSLEVNTGDNCSIEGVMGKKTYSSLRPGQIITALVKVKVGAWRRYGASSINEDSDSPPNSFDLLDELDLMLGATSTTLLTARLKYRHSLFPPGTMCSITGSCEVKHPFSDAKGDKDPPKAGIYPNWVQKRLMFHLATHHSPKNAIVTLIGQFGVDGRNSVCSDYFKLVINELKYQARVLERLESSYVNSIISSDLDNLYEHFGQGLFDIENFKPMEWMPETPEESDKDPHESVQAEAWNARSLDLGGISSYDTRMEGEWLANATFRNAISPTAKRTEKAGIPDTADKDDESDDSTIVGAQSKYILDAPPTAHTISKSYELIKSAFKENRPVTDVEIRSHQVHKDIRKKNLSAIRPMTPIGAPRSWVADDDGNFYLISPLTPRSFKSPAQSQSPSPQQRMTPTSSDDSDGAHETWNDMGKRSMGGNVVHHHHQPIRPIIYGGSRPPPEYPQVIVAKNEEERIRLMKDFALKNNRSLGEGSLRNLARTAGGGGGATAERTDGTLRAFGPPWA